MTGYLSAMGSYARLRGRASRGEFWGFSILTTIIIFVSLIIDAAYISGPGSKDHPFAGLVILLHLLPTLAVSIRRLHDTDRSGWLLLINIIPFVGVVLLVVWGCQSGTAGPNRFGMDPLGGRATPYGFEPTLAASPVPRDLIGEIERLAQLRANGSLTDAEFETLKSQAVRRV